MQILIQLTLTIFKRLHEELLGAVDDCAAMQIIARFLQSIDNCDDPIDAPQDEVGLLLKLDA